MKKHFPSLILGLVYIRTHFKCISIISYLNYRKKNSEAILRFKFCHLLHNKKTKDTTQQTIQ